MLSQAPSIKLELSYFFYHMPYIQFTPVIQDLASHLIASLFSEINESRQHIMHQLEESDQKIFSKYETLFKNLAARAKPTPTEFNSKTSTDAPPMAVNSSPLICFEDPQNKCLSDIPSPGLLHNPSSLIATDSDTAKDEPDQVVGAPPTSTTSNTLPSNIIDHSMISLKSDREIGFESSNGEQAQIPESSNVQNYQESPGILISDGKNLFPSVKDAAPCVSKHGSCQQTSCTMDLDGKHPVSDTEIDDLQDAVNIGLEAAHEASTNTERDTAEESHPVGLSVLLDAALYQGPAMYDQSPSLFCIPPPRVVPAGGLESSNYPTSQPPLFAMKTPTTAVPSFSTVIHGPALFDLSPATALGLDIPETSEARTPVGCISLSEKGIVASEGSTPLQDNMTDPHSPSSEYKADGVTVTAESPPAPPSLSQLISQYSQQYASHASESDDESGSSEETCGTHDDLIHDFPEDSIRLTIPESELSQS
jgi:hypothetical protein